VSTRARYVSLRTLVTISGLPVLRSNFGYLVFS
jgi:hypothetical protein